MLILRIFLAILSLCFVSWSYAEDFLEDTVECSNCTLVPIHRGPPAPYWEVQPPPPFIPSAQPPVKADVTSGNWSGYVAMDNLASPKAGSVSDVHGTWVVPTVHATSIESYSSSWIGIDGAKSNSVEQLGTEHDWYGGAQYYAWVEMYPKYPFMIQNFPVRPGDVINAQITYAGNGVFKMTIVNRTAGVHYIAPVSRTTSQVAERKSAEWITEAPYSGGVLPLANFGTEVFSGCSTTIDGTSGSISNTAYKHQSIEMGANGVVKAIPSALTNQGQGFTVTWKHT